MKKRMLLGCFAFLLMVITIIGLNYFNSKNSDDSLRVIKVAEVAHSIFYAPFYVAIENGYFEDKIIFINPAQKKEVKMNVELEDKQ